MKLLLYCTKQPPYLLKHLDNTFSLSNYVEYSKIFENGYLVGVEYRFPVMNGKIVAECDFEVEEIKYRFGYYNTGDWFESYILKNTCLSVEELDSYLQASKNYDEKKVPNPCGYAIHIKNLDIFDNPKDLSEYYKQLSSKEYDTKINKLGYRPKEWLNVPVSISRYFAVQSILEPLKKAPQNMMYVCEYDKSTSIEDYYKRNILISIRPEWLCKILNGEKTIEVRKKVLRCMKDDKQ